MTSAAENLSPGKRYALKMLALMEADPEIAALQPSEDIGLAINQAPTYEAILELALTGYAQRPALGERVYSVREDVQSGRRSRVYEDHFSTISYAELRSRIVALASAWRHLPAHAVAPGDRVCIMGSTGVDFAVVDFACVYAQAVTVPLQSATSGGDLTEIFANIEPITLATTLADLEVCVEHAVGNGRMRSLVVFDYDPRVDAERERVEAAQKALADSGVATSMIALTELIALGREHEWTALAPSVDGVDRLAAIIHSSGSTGKPKGAMLPEDALKMIWEVRPRQLPVVTLCFAPLNHLLGRSSMVAALRVGGTAYFTLKPDMSTLFEDIRLVRPTMMTFFPRVFEMVYQHYQNEVARALRAGDEGEERVKARVAGEMGRHFLGDRLHGAMIGGAPTSNVVKDFMCNTFDLKLNEGYGNTESGSGGLVFDGVVQRPTVREYRLRDVPELGYYTTDKPYPRGEFCFKSRGQIAGYYKAPEATAGLFDEDGFSLTGDIVEERAPDRVVVIDRRKDVLKLSQGEYVAVGNLGTVYEAGSAVIRQIYIYGNSLRAYLLAVVVPDLEVAATVLGEGYAEADLRQFVRDELQRVAGEQQLKGFEVPRDFILDEEPFSQENGLLSSVRKRLRPALKRKYGERLESLYSAHEDDQDAELQALKDPHSGLSIAQKLKRLLELQLKADNIDISRRRTFAELGGDSLGAVLFSMAIEDVFGVTVSADTILSPTASPAKWIESIERALSGKVDRPTFARVHGKGATVLKAADLQLERFLGEELLVQASQALAPVTQTDTRTVLVTGGNGFLGRLVCLNWLEKLAPRGGRVICIVRAADDEAARARLDTAFSGADPRFGARYRELGAGHLEVLAGDASEERLGLAETVFTKLAAEVDRIVHVAALVNHRFSYPNLFGPNVVGTAEIIRLALSTRRKPVDFVSSEAVLPLLNVLERADEDAPLLADIELMDNYAAGYGASKWAAEQLLRRAHEQFGLPVNVFRGDMMLPHREYAGVLNREDMFTRLLFSIIKTGLAPLSFYRLMPNGCLAYAHYDGTPVDVVAAAVAGADDNVSDEYRNYNIQNFHHDDGCSLDAFVDWIQRAGYPVIRIEDHRDWFRRFSDALSALPETERQQSALDILQAFRNPISFRARPIACERFRALVDRLPAGPGAHQGLPHLDEPYLRKCLADMHGLGLIPAPEPVVQSSSASAGGAATAAYGAVSATAPLAPMSITRRLPEPDDVAIDILYCGVCHSDLHYAKNEWGVSTYPLVPGHEIVGRVTSVGEAVTRFSPGDVVAVGCLVDSCRHCRSCDDGLEQYCDKGVVMTYGAIDYRHQRQQTMGGYSTHIVVNDRFVLRVPEGLDPAGAAPLLCAGITTYSPLRQWQVGPGQKVGVIGLGGLGHMGVKLARAMGAEVVMITTSPEKGADARRLGASDVLVSKDREAMRAHRHSFDFLLDTVPVPHPLNPYLQLLRRDGTLASVGALEPMEGIHGALVSAQRLRVVGSMIGGLPETQEMLDFCAEHGITADIELIRMQEINTAYERMQRNDVKYRFVIDMGSLC